MLTFLFTGKKKQKDEKSHVWYLLLVFVVSCTRFARYIRHVKFLTEVNHAQHISDWLEEIGLSIVLDRGMHHLSGSSFDTSPPLTMRQSLLKHAVKYIREIYTPVLDIRLPTVKGYWQIPFPLKHAVKQNQGKVLIQESTNPAVLSVLLL